MKLTNENYCATVVRLNSAIPINGADKIVLFSILGESVIMSKDTDLTKLYLMFPSGTCINPLVLQTLNLYNDASLNEDKTKKGYFSKKGIVKSVTLKGVISTAFVLPVESLSFLGKIEVKEGDKFNEINGVEVCYKYEAPINVHTDAPKEFKDRKVLKLKDVIINNQFHFHDDTAHFGRNIHKFNLSDVIIVTSKLHGSSCILSHVLVNKPLTKFQKLWNKINFLSKYPTKEYGYVWSSGKPKSGLPKGVSTGYINSNQSFYSQDIWKETFDKYKHTLEKGISLYGEIVGSKVQKGYNYGLKAEEIEFYVYRITKVDSFGKVIEFSWQQIKDYCNKYNLLHVEELYFGSYFDLVKDLKEEELLPELSKLWLEKDCVTCSNPKLPDEGVVIRIDGKLEHYSAYKFKSKRFIAHETQQLENETT